MGAPSVATHLISKEKFKQWENKELYFLEDNPNNTVFLTRKEAEKIIELTSARYGNGETFEEIIEDWSTNGGIEDNLFQEHDLYSFNLYFHFNREVYAFTNEIEYEGKELVIFGYITW